MTAPRAILHVDMDAFFASVEQLDHPELRGKPVLVGYDGPRGVVAAASYEARVYGCRSAQPIAVARRRCPHAIIISVRGSRYREVSGQVFEVLESYTPLVEPLSIDEAFLDVTGSQLRFGTPPEIARRIKERIRERTGLTASIGVAGNKFLAKLASDMDKPDGLTVVPGDGVRKWLAPLPIGRMWGVGPVTEARLTGLGLGTFGAVSACPPEQLRQRVGDLAERLHRLSHGLDDRPVTPDHEAKSLGHEQTFGEDLQEPEEVRRVLLRQLEQVAERLRRHDLRARTVTVKIRFGDFETITRSATLPASTDRTATLWSSTRELFDGWVQSSFRPVRLIGVSASQLQRQEDQLTLFGNPSADRDRRLDKTTDAIRRRFGRGAIRRAGGLPSNTAPERKDPLS